MTHRKKFSEFGSGTNEENNAKTAAFNYEISSRRYGLKNTQNSSFFMNQKFSMHFLRKLL